LILDGKAVASKVLDEVRAGVGRLREGAGVTPTLAVILVGDFAPSKIYVNTKKKAADGVGIASRDYLYPDGLAQGELLKLIGFLNDDPAIHGILLQLPLPDGLDEDAAIAAIAPEKDADGFHPANLGRLLAGKPDVVPATPAGCMAILDHYGAALTGAEAVVVGRSRIVGKPLAQLLLARHATVTMCHTRTRDLAAHTRRADILCVAAGRAGIITGDMVKPGAWVIDVGTNRLPTGKLAGDVDFASVSQVAHAITPVPGGVGPMTVAMLLRNTLAAAERTAYGRPQPFRVEGRTTYLDEAVEVTGKHEFAGTVVVNGRYTGELAATDTIVVGECGVVSARLEAPVVVVHGRVSGYVVAAQEVEIGERGRLVGDVESPSVTITRGGYFDGHVRDVGGPTPGTAG
jgi:methylenetetrahydrofolate dehydrogenase (NADP+)/methenyltetrahydrofolate cyclohydrolase